MSKSLSRRQVVRDASGAALLGLAPMGPALAAAPTVKIANALGALNQTMDALLIQEKFLESVGLTQNILGVSDGTKILGGIVGGSADASAMSGFGLVFPAVERGAP